MVKNRLKEIRLKEYMQDNQKAFAEMLGIRPSQYNRYETGTNTPTLQIALKITQKLNKSIHDIWYLDAE